MGIRVFETEDARYYLGLGCHLSSSDSIFKDVNFKDIDFLVLEDSGGGSVRRLTTHRQYAALERRAISEHPEIRFYCVDVWPSFFGGISDNLISAIFLAEGCGSANEMIVEKKNLSRRDFLRHSCMVGLGAFFGSSLYVPAITIIAGRPPGLTEVYNLKTSILPTELLAYRDAIAAKKISGYLVPKYKRKGRKVNAAILYGAAHSGIESKLKHPWIADKTIDFFHKTLKVGNLKERGEIREITLYPNGVTFFERYDSGLF